MLPQTWPRWELSAGLSRRLGSEAGLRDIALDKVAVSQTAFEDAPVTVQAEVTAHGFAGSDVKRAIDRSHRRRFQRRGATNKPARDDESA
jgi:hypothetical protein